MQIKKKNKNAPTYGMVINQTQNSIIPVLSSILDTYLRINYMSTRQFVDKFYYEFIKCFFPQGFGLTNILLRRETRFSKVSARFFNTSTGKVIEFNIQQSKGHHYLSMHTIAILPVPMDSVRHPYFDWPKEDTNLQDQILFIFKVFNAIVLIRYY